jgi:hypothetical protein
MVKVNAPHLSMVSDPDAVTDLIQAAAAHADRHPCAGRTDRPAHGRHEPDSSHVDPRQPMTQPTLHPAGTRDPDVPARASVQLGVVG